METIPKTTRLPKNLLNAIKFRTKKENVDESTALRQLLNIGVQEYATFLYSEGKITLREAADLSNVSLREMIDITMKYKIKGNIDYETQKKSLNVIKELIDKRNL